MDDSFKKSILNFIETIKNEIEITNGSIQTGKEIIEKYQRICENVSVNKKKFTRPSQHDFKIYSLLNFELLTETEETRKKILNQFFESLNNFDSNSMEYLENELTNIISNFKRIFLQKLVKLPPDMKKLLEIAVDSQIQNSLNVLKNYLKVISRAVENFHGMVKEISFIELNIESLRKTLKDKKKESITKINESIEGFAFFLSKFKQKLLDNIQTHFDSKVEEIIVKKISYIQYRRENFQPYDDFKKEAKIIFQNFSSMEDLLTYQDEINEIKESFHAAMLSSLHYQSLSKGHIQYFLEHNQSDSNAYLKELENNKTIFFKLKTNFNEKLTELNAFVEESDLSRCDLDELRATFQYLANELKSIFEKNYVKENIFADEISTLRNVAEETVGDFDNYLTTLKVIKEDVNCFLNKVRDELKEIKNEQKFKVRFEMKKKIFQRDCVPKILGKNFSLKLRVNIDNYINDTIDREIDHLVKTRKIVREFRENEKTKIVIVEEDLRNKWNECVYQHCLSKKYLEVEFLSIRDIYLKKCEERIKNMDIDKYYFIDYGKEFKNSIDKCIDKLLIKYDNLKNSKSIQCLYFDKFEDLKLTSFFKNKCSQSWKDKKIIVISIVGPARKGKSTFLNYLYHFLKYEEKGKHLKVNNIFDAEYNLEYDHVTDGITSSPELLDIEYV